MVKEIRLTLYGLQVLGIFSKHKNKRLAGSDIASLINLTAGTLYPMLARFEKAGLLESVWETGNPQDLKRPRKNFYKITDLGNQRFKFERAHRTANL